VASPKSKTAPPSKVELARAEFEKVRREFNDLRKPGAKCALGEKSVAAARYAAAGLLVEAEKAQEAADAARKRADEALKDVEKAAATPAPTSAKTSAK
jgi:hypothetical protein